MRTANSADLAQELEPLERGDHIRSDRYAVRLGVVVRADDQYVWVFEPPLPYVCRLRREFVYRLSAGGGE